MKFAEAIKDYLPANRAREALNKFEDIFNEHYLKKMRKKFGIFKELDTDSLVKLKIWIYHIG